MIDQTLGNSIRCLRERRGVTLRTLAQRTHFSASFLSQVENGRSSASIASIDKIAKALGSNLGQLFSAVSSPPSVVEYRSRTELACLPRLSVLLLSLQPGETSPSTGQFALVFEGRVVLKLQESEQTLERGDSVTIAAGIKPQWRNETESLAEILMVSLGMV